MATVLELVTTSLKEIGAIGIEETPTAPEANDAFKALNSMLDSWNIEKLMIYSVVENVFNLQAAKSVYTLGAGGDFNIPRPVRIDNAYARDLRGNDFDIYIANANEYSSITAKYTTTTIPTVLYNDGNYPLSNITLWPVPSSGEYRLVLWTWEALTKFANLQQEIVFPPGYQLALETNLAIRLCPRYGRTPSEELKLTAVTSKAQVKRINTSINQLGFPAALMRSGLPYNYRTDGYGVH